MGVLIPTTIPSYQYNGGTATPELKSDWGWVIRFTSSGTLIFDEDQTIDVHILGGGGGGGGGGASPGGGGGGGWQTIKFGINVKAGTPYSIVVGAGAETGLGNNGGDSSAFGFSAAGGKGGELGDSKSTVAAGGDGGTGAGGRRDGSGFSNTVREFAMADISWPIYGGGGSSGNGASGGSPYGGNSDSPATGYGGGGGGSSGWDDFWERAGFGGAGGSGLVAIRNSEINTYPIVFNGESDILSFTFKRKSPNHMTFNSETLF